MTTKTVNTSFAYPAIAAMAVAFAGATGAADDKHHAGDDHTPKHGGIVAPTKAMDFELVVKPTTIQLNLRDHGKPIDITKATDQGGGRPRGVHHGDRHRPVVLLRFGPSLGDGVAGRLPAPGGERIEVSGPWSGPPAGRHPAQ